MPVASTDNKGVNRKESLSNVPSFCSVYFCEFIPSVQLLAFYGVDACLGRPLFSQTTILFQLSIMVAWLHEINACWKLVQHSCTPVL